MRRISHDLPGVTQRIAKLYEDFEVEVQAAQEVWRDEKGRSFFQQHTTGIGPGIKQLVSSMTRAIELFETVARRARDPDNE